MADVGVEGSALFGAVPATSVDVRDELADLLRRDLLGPWGGESEVFEPREERSPRDRYIAGLLAPADAAVSEQERTGAEMDDGDLAAGSDGDETPGSASRSEATRFFPSSMGMSFAMPTDVTVLRVAGAWGRYERVPLDDLRELTKAGDAPAAAGAESDAVERAEATAPLDGGVDDEQAAREAAAAGDTDDADSLAEALSGDGKQKSRSRGKKGWRRVPVVPKPLLIDVSGDGVDWFADENKGVRVAVRWQARVVGGSRLVSVWLVNEQTAESFPNLGGADSAWLFQAGFEVTAADGQAPVFVCRPDMDGVGRDIVGDAEQDLLAMLYRDTPEYAVGHGVSTVFSEPATHDPAVGRRAWRLATEALPADDVPQTIAPNPQQVPGLEGLVLDMAVLAAGSSGAAVDGLRPLVDAYRNWLDTQEARIVSEPGLSAFTAVAAEQVARARAAADRVEAGLELLLADPLAWHAFRFANEAMAAQRVHIEAVKTRKENPGLSWKDAERAADVPTNRSWRPFQIAFVLLNLPALTDPGHPDRVGGGIGTDLAVADLLFFPTGGGKTEAYLGLTAYTFAIRRLQGPVPSGDGELDGGRGVAVIMRYTLRLLTAQQFQRAAALVCAAEVLRRKSLNGESQSLGGEPFTLGLWVGGKVTPNNFGEAKAYVKAKKGVGKRSDAFSISPVPIRECPWCGSSVDPARDVDTNPKTRRVVIYCGDTTGKCQFTSRNNHSFGLPIVAVDEQIYREPPSLLIATVDKFAQLPWNGATGHLFGRVTRRCERHGFRHPDYKSVCSADSHQADGELRAARTVVTGWLRPPDLIIQDELHLISGALGTMVGLYETAVDRLATWEYQGVRVRPKVVASTATIRRAAEQGYALFRRSLTVFPPPVIDVSDSFFARQIPVTSETPGRRYVGVCAQGLRLKATEIRVTSAIMSFAQTLFDQHPGADSNPADPYMTLVAYFNALRELGGMRRLIDDDVQARLARPNHAGMSRRGVNVVEELTSRIPSDRIPDTLKRLDSRFGTAHTTAGRKAAWEAAQKPKRGSKAVAPDFTEWPVDVLLATNMFAVGVDVSRLGLMTMTGQPKSTAEYIQATSRVGRDPSRPGLIVTIYNWARPRDISYYERFGAFHAAFYQQVEALSVTPFSLPALERGLTGAFVGALRNLEADLNPDTGLDLVTDTSPAWVALADDFADRASAVASDAAIAGDVRNLLDKRLKDLGRQKTLGAGTETLTYRVKGDGKRRVLRTPDSEPEWGKWTTPNSLRETEPDINLVLLPDDPAVEQEHLKEWVPASVTQSGINKPADQAAGGN